MTEINLLPWRETLRNATKKEFLTLLAITLGLMFFIVVLALSRVKTKMQHQQVLNTQLQQNIAALAPKMVALAALTVEFNTLNAQQDALEHLQIERSVTVHLLEQVVYQIPSGVYLTRLDKKGMQLTFEGIAEANARVSEFMQKIAEAQGIVEPHLAKVTVADGKEDSGGYYFKMTARCV